LVAPSKEATVQSGCNVKPLLVKDEIVVWVDRIIAAIQVGKNFWSFQVSGIPEDLLDLLLLVPDKVEHLDQEHVDVDLFKRKGPENANFCSCRVTFIAGINIL
jgi:hypothetical protein